MAAPKKGTIEGVQGGFVTDVLEDCSVQCPPNWGAGARAKRKRREQTT